MIVDNSGLIWISGRIVDFMLIHYFWHIWLVVSTPLEKKIVNGKDCFYQYMEK